MWDAGKDAERSEQGLVPGSPEPRWPSGHHVTVSLSQSPVQVSTGLSEEQGEGVGPVPVRFQRLPP